MLFDILLNRQKYFAVALNTGQEAEHGLETGLVQGGRKDTVEGGFSREEIGVVLKVGVHLN